MAENKKIKNASETEYNGIKFKSKLECTIYKVLVENEYEPLYEEFVFTLQEGFRPETPFYTRDAKTRKLKQDTTKVRDITYTPDFVMEVPTPHGHILVIIECKGYMNDTYPLKRKMFRRLMECEEFKHTVFFEIYTKKNLLEALAILNKMKNEDSRPD